MREVIVDLDAFEVFPIEQGRIGIHRRIVRCKDCKHAEDLTKLHDSWFCKRNVCAKPPIEPDGFCSWGEWK